MAETQRATTSASARLRRALAPVSSNQLDPRRGNGSKSSNSESNLKLKRSLLPLLGTGNGNNRKACDSSLTPANKQSRATRNIVVNKPTTSATTAPSKRNTKNNDAADQDSSKTGNKQAAASKRTTTISSSSSLVVFRSGPHQHITHTSIELQLGHPLVKSTPELDSDDSYLVNESYEYNECDEKVKKATTFVLDHDLSMEVDKRRGGDGVEKEGVDYHLMWENMLDENKGKEEDDNLDSNMLDEKNGNGNNENDDPPKKKNNEDEDEEFSNNHANKLDGWKSSNDDDKENEPPAPANHYTRENLTNQNQLEHEDAYYASDNARCYTCAVFREQQQSSPHYHAVDADMSHDSIELQLQLHLGHPINESYIIYCTSVDNESESISSQDCNDAEQYSVHTIEKEEGGGGDDNDNIILNSNHHEGFVRIHNSRVMSGVQFLQLHEGGADLSMEVEKDIVENGEQALEWSNRM